MGPQTHQGGPDWAAAAPWPSLARFSKTCGRLRNEQNHSPLNLTQSYPPNSVTLLSLIERSALLLSSPHEETLVDALVTDCCHKAPS